MKLFAVFGCFKERFNGAIVEDGEMIATSFIATAVSAGQNAMVGINTANQAFLFSGSKKEQLNCVKPTAVTWLGDNEFVIADGRQIVFYSTRLQKQGKVYVFLSPLVSIENEMYCFSQLKLRWRSKLFPDQVICLV